MKNTGYKCRPNCGLIIRRLIYSNWKIMRCVDGVEATIRDGIFEHKWCGPFFTDDAVIIDYFYHKVMEPVKRKMQ